MRIKEALENRLVKKGAILVFVPLLFQVICGLALFWLEQQYETVLLEQARAKAIIYHTNEIWHRSTGIITRSLETRIENAPGLPASMDRTIEHIEASYKELQSLVQNDNKQRAELNRLWKICKQIRSIGSEMDKNTASKSSSIATGQLQVFNEEYRFLRRMQKLLLTVTDEVRRFKEPEQLRASQITESLNTLRAIIQVALLIAFAANLLISAILFLFFMQTIYNGIKVLRANTLRLAQSQPLLPLMNSQDEFAELDKTFHKMARDLTASRRRELAAINNAADMICMLSPELQITLLNPAGENLLGYVKNELNEKNCKDLIASKDRETFSFAMANLMTQNEAIAEFDCHLENKEAAVLFSSWKVKWSQAERALFCVVHDETENRKIEELKQVFTAMISHELRTPLTSMQAFLSNVRTGVMGSLPGKLKEGAATSEFEVASLVRLLNDFLDLEKIAAGKMAFRPRKINTEEVIETAVSLFLQRRTRERLPQISINSAEFDIYADPNLISNAIAQIIFKCVELSRDDTAEIIIDAERNPESEAVKLNLNIAGLEIQARDSNRLFERYALVETDSNQPEEGIRSGSFSGLGLLVAKAIVELHSGTVGLDLDKGSTFWIKLPDASVPSSSSS